ncbi:MAG: ATP-binding cassette domain-containing protein [Eubacteriales bacterium]|nr:ATP-binding cassette domain-containing protein [Eubacteriales bacterium]
MELLKVENLSFSYPKQEKDTAPAGKVIEDLSFSVESGEFIVICGASGCGKTTLLRLLKRELSPHGIKTGEILFGGKRQEELTDREAACQIGFVLQNPENQIVTDKVWHELAFGLENMGMTSSEIRRKVAEMACYFGIDDWFRHKTSDLSGGQKQLVNLASVMAMDPKLLILDEPTSQLDPIAASTFINTLYKLNRELGLTIILTEHRLEEVFPIADRVLIMDKGRKLCMAEPREAGGLLRRQAPDHRMLQGFPSAMRIYQGLDPEEEVCPVTVREGRDFVERKYDNRIRSLNRPEAENDGKIAMRMKDICFRYEKNGDDILQNVHLTVRHGEMVSLLGGNGAGKSTLLQVIAGILHPYRGKIEVFGKRIERFRDSELYVRGLAFLPQNPQSVFLKMTVLEDYEEIRPVMGYSKEEFDRKVREIAAFLEIEDLLQRHPYDLSGGEQQKAAIGKILLREPRFLLLDEPTKGIDAWTKKRFGELLQKLKARGIGILMVTHDVEFAAAYSNRCGLFFDHEVLAMETPETFFCSNNYYTTAANRIARRQYDGVLLVEDVIELCRQNGSRQVRE